MNSHVFWCGTLWSKSIEKRLEAADAGRFSEVSIFPTDVQQFTADGNSVREIQTLAADYDADVTILDPFTKWIPDWSPPDADAVPPLFEFDEDEFFRMGEALNIDSFTVLEPFGEPINPYEGATQFGRLCDRAAEHGWQVHLEFIPFTGIPDLETAWEIVDRAGRDNGGLLFDTWHYYRGNPDNELLRTIPGEKIFRVQIADAHSKVQGDLQEDSLKHRQLPGEGDLDLVHALRILDEIGGLDSVGVEILSEELDERPAKEVGRHCEKCLDDLLEAAGVAPS